MLTWKILPMQYLLFFQLKNLQILPKLAKIDNTRKVCQYYDFYLNFSNSSTKKLTNFLKIGKFCNFCSVKQNFTMFPILIKLQLHKKKKSIPGHFSKS